MDELLTYTEGDSDTASSSPISSGVVISEGPVLIGPISIPKVEENATESDGGGVQGEGSSDASPQHTPEAIDTHGTIAVGDVTSLELDSGEATKLSASTADTDGEDPKGTPTAETDQSSSQSEPREADNAQDTPEKKQARTTTMPMQHSSMIFGHRCNTTSTIARPGSCGPAPSSWAV